MHIGNTDHLSIRNVLIKGNIAGIQGGAAILSKINNTITKDM